MAVDGIMLRIRRNEVDRFIVGTGRCGSTLLSRMIGEHPAVVNGTVGLVRAPSYSMPTRLLRSAVMWHPLNSVALLVFGGLLLGSMLV